MKAIVFFVVLTLALMLTQITHASDATDAERDLEAMKGITESFCKTKKLCENKEHLKFTVFRFYAEQTEKLLSRTEVKIIEDCSDKYQVEMTTGKTESIHIYCYDSWTPRLLVEKHLVDKQ